MPEAGATVGASGSCTMTAKLRVPAGGFRQVAAGEVFCPVQPKPLKAYACLMVEPGAMSGLLNSKRKRGMARESAKAANEPHEYYG